MSRREQISAFVFRPSNSCAPEYLALRRAPERGGFWQGVTGGLEHFDHEGVDSGVQGSGTRHAAGAIREIGEELDLNTRRIYETYYNFSFTDPEDGELVEHVVAAEVEEDAEPTLSDEHDAAFWVNSDDMRSLVGAKWVDNVIGFDKAHQQVADVYPEKAANSFGPDHWSLIIEKPDVRELGIEDEVRRGLRALGLRAVLDLNDLQLDQDLVDGIWIPPKVRDPWYQATVEYMTRTPVNVQLVYGDHATEKVMDIKRQLRMKYDKNYRDDETAPFEKRVESIIHGSDRMEELARQALLFFSWPTLTEVINDEKRSN